MTQPNPTLCEALLDALKRASTYNRNDQIAPAAVLWPDKERLWEPIIPRLRDRLPLLTFGPYLPAQRSGPAYWLRCILAGTLDDRLPQGDTPIIYLPGVSKADLRAVDECPRSLQPLAELQYRGLIWTHRNGREWTPAGFLQAADGIGVELAADTPTREALQRALPRLMDEPVAQLRRAAPLRADFFDALLTPDTPRSLLLWLNNPSLFRQRGDANAWAAFNTQAQRGYGITPERDGPISAAARLGGRQDAWTQVWERFAEAPDTYPNLPDLLRRARPAQLPMFDTQETWPQDNEAEEQKLRERLSALRTMHVADARAEIGQLEREHAARRAWVWTRLGQSPLVVALAALHDLVTYTTVALHGSATEIRDSYTGHGWRADAAALSALACVEHSSDVAAVGGVLHALYQPWCEQGVHAFQAAYTPPPAAALPPPVDPGTCILFCAALRYDLAQQIAHTLSQHGVNCALEAELAPLSGMRSRADLAQADIPTLTGDATGDPTGTAWCACGAINVSAHPHGERLSHHLTGELRALERRITDLLHAGWSQVVVITDHGWLLPSGVADDEAGSDHAHGGMSAQAWIIPRLTATQGGAVVARISRVEWRGLRCTVSVDGEPQTVTVDLRSRAADPDSSLLAAARSPGNTGSAALLVEDEDRMGESALVVLLDQDGMVISQRTTTVGGA